MGAPVEFTVLDAIYGDISLPPAVADLARTPLLQRLRQVRLSNIDSLDMPGIANISRYEHSLGTAFLATRVGFVGSLSDRQRDVFQAAALVHDSAITPYGHLAEEALEFVQSDFHHELKWDGLFSNRDYVEVGGLDRQIYQGRPSGLREWAEKNHGGEALDVLKTIFETVQGRGRFGPCIAGTLDLDNLDNVVRMAFHMGLRPDLALPLRVAMAMSTIDQHGIVRFERDAIPYVQSWTRIREQLYERLMPAPLDFAGKIMLLYATVEAFRSDLLGRHEWALTDMDFISRLVSSKQERISKPTADWLLGDLWPVTTILWMRGAVPKLPDLYEFSRLLSRNLARECFAYRIRDKRTRRIDIALVDGEIVSLGHSSDLWLFAVGSPVRRPFTQKHEREIVEFAREHFDSEPASPRSSEVRLF